MSVLNNWTNLHEIKVTVLSKFIFATFDLAKSVLIHFISNVLVWVFKKQLRYFFVIKVKRVSQLDVSVKYTKNLLRQFIRFKWSVENTKKFKSQTKTKNGGGLKLT